MNYVAVIFSVMTLFFGMSGAVNETKVNDGASTSESKKKECTEKINEGASTSCIHYPSYESVINGYRLNLRFQKEQSIYAEKCEINAFVDNHINSIARSNKHTQPNVNSIPVNEFYSSLARYLKYGSNYNATNEHSRPLPNYKERIRYYDLSTQSDVLQTLMDSCLNPLPDDVLENIQDFSRTVLKNVFEKQTKNCFPNPNFLNILKDSCLHYFRQLIHHYVLGCFFNTNTYCNQSTPVASDVFLVNNIVVMRYNIIPLRLIHLFFQQWSQSSTQIMYHNECLRAYFSSFSTEIILQYNITRQATNYTDIRNLQDTFRQLGLNGNSIYAPAQLRNRFHRNFIDNRFVAENWIREIYLFEYDAESLVGREHYQELLNLYKRLMDYIGEDPYEKNAYERYLSGIGIYESMMRIFSSYNTPPMNFDLWEKRYLTEEELSALAEDLDNTDEYFFYSILKFWSVKEKFKKSKRSVPESIKKQSVEKFSEQRWSEFVVYLMNIFVQAKISGASISWSNNFSNLYAKYRLSLSSNTTGHGCLDNNFDTYLYSKISSTKEWSECINFDESEKTHKWCQAWRRIMLDSNFNSESSWNKLTDKQFFQDLETLINWVGKKIQNECKEKMCTNVKNFGYVVDL